VSDVAASMRSRPAMAARLARLYLLSRRVPAAMVALGATAVALHLVLHWAPVVGGFAVELPLLATGAAAVVIGAGLRSPFDESERATGVPLPLLRLGNTAAVSAIAYGALAAGAVGARLPSGAVGLLRDLTGVVGVTLLAAAFGRGSLAWLATLSYLLLAMSAVTLGWTTPWLWPARPPTDHGAAICATLAFVAGLTAVTVRGPRETGRD
jgi:hypothetical protein